MENWVNKKTSVVIDLEIERTGPKNKKIEYWKKEIQISNMERRRKTKEERQDKVKDKA